MTRTNEAKIEEIFQRHIDAAIDEIAQADDLIIDFWWPIDFNSRLATMCANSLGLAEESVQAWRENESE